MLIGGRMYFRFCTERWEGCFSSLFWPPQWRGTSRSEVWKHLQVHQHKVHPMTLVRKLYINIQHQVSPMIDDCLVVVSTVSPYSLGGTVWLLFALRILTGWQFLLKTISILNFYRNHRTVWDCLSADHPSIRAPGLWPGSYYWTPRQWSYLQFRSNCIPLVTVGTSF